MANSSEIFTPAMERFTLSRNATALRTKSKKTRNQRTRLVGCEVIYRYSSRSPAWRTRLAHKWRILPSRGMGFFEELDKLCGDDFFFAGFQHERVHVQATFR